MNEHQPTVFCAATAGDNDASVGAGSTVATSSTAGADSTVDTSSAAGAASAATANMAPPVPATIISDALMRSSWPPLADLALFCAGSDIADPATPSAPDDASRPHAAGAPAILRHVAAVHAADRRITVLDDDLGAFLWRVPGSQTISVVQPIIADAPQHPQHPQHLQQPLCGVPIAVADNIAVHGLPMTCASRALEGYHPPQDATVVAKLKAAGAVIIGKTNQDEFGMGSSTEYSAYRPCRNPWHTEHAPGGSTGGAAVAVAAGMVPVALGSDAGGGVRQAAGLCGVAGFKPSFGTVSRSGVALQASSLEQVGVLGARVADIRLVYQIIRGPDGPDGSDGPDGPCGGGDETVVNTPQTAIANRASTPISAQSNVKVGILHDCPACCPLSDAVREALAGCAEECRQAGWTVTPVTIPELGNTALAAYYVTACAEATSGLSRFDGIRFGARTPNMPDDADLFVADTRSLFGPEVKLRILLGNLVLRTGNYQRYFAKAQKVRRILSAELNKLFAVFDLLLAPVFPTQAPRLGKLLGDPLALKQADQFTVAANLTGIPAISLPVGVTQGLPTAVQLWAPRFADDRLLELAAILEQRLGFDNNACPARQRLLAAQEGDVA